MSSNISNLTSVCVYARVCVCERESEWVCGYFCVCVLCVQIQPRACAYTCRWQINPGNPNLRRQSEEVRLRIHTRTGLSLCHTQTAGKWQKCNLVSGMASVASDMGWL